MTWPTKTDFVDGDVLTAAQVNNIGTNLNLADPTGITDGYVLTADGAGGMGWEAVSAGGMFLITSGTMPTANTLTLSSIPSTYTDLVLMVENATGNTGFDAIMRINNSSSALYARQYRYGTPIGESITYGDTSWPFAVQGIQGGSANGVFYVRFPRYASNSAKVGHFLYHYFNNSSQYTTGHGTLGYQSDIIINRIDIIASGGGTQWTGGQYYLYGVK